MVEYVRLKNTDLELLISVMQRVTDYKFRRLTKNNWQEFEQNYLPSLVQQIYENKFKVVSAVDNTFIWCIDQIMHSRQCVAGIDPANWIPLADFEDVQQCLRLLRAASRGQASYQRYTEPNQFHHLFT